MKYLIRDCDRTERIVLEAISIAGVAVARNTYQRNWRDTSTDQLGKPLNLIAVFDEDGEIYEELEMIVTMAFTRKGHRYYSNGVFAIEATAPALEQVEIAALFARINGED